MFPRIHIISYLMQVNSGCRSVVVSRSRYTRKVPGSNSGGYRTFYNFFLRLSSVLETSFMYVFTNYTLFGSSILLILFYVLKLFEGAVQKLRPHCFGCLFL